MLDVRLRDHIDDIAPPLSLAEIRERTPAEAAVELEECGPEPVLVEFETAEPDRPRGRVLAAAAAVIVASLLGGFALAALVGDRGDVTTAADDAAGRLPALPGDLASAEWREIAEPFGGLQAGTTVEVRDVVVSNGVAWAVGSEGLTTERQTDGVFDQDAGLSGRAALWRSVDGARWEPFDLGLAPLDAPVAQVTAFEALEFAVATSDGAMWAFGTDFLFDDSGDDEVFSAAPIGYRSSDGESWQPLTPPPIDGADSFVTSVSSDGSGVFVEIASADFFADGSVEDEVLRSFTTVDGETWNQVSEVFDGDSARVSLLARGEVISVSNADLSGGSGLPTILAAGPEFFVIVSEDSGFLPGETIPNDAPFLQETQIWVSEEGETWRELELPDWEEPNSDFASAALGHDAGVLVIIDRDTQERTEVVLVDVNSAGEVEDLGVLPPAAVDDMFALNGQFFLLGRPQSSGDPFEPIPDSLWVAEFPPADAAGDG